MYNPIVEKVDELIKDCKLTLLHIQELKDKLELLEKERLEKLSGQAKLVHFGDKK